MDPMLAEARNHAAAIRLSLELLHEDAWCAEQRALIASALQTSSEDWLRRVALSLAGKQAWLTPETALGPTIR